MTSSVILEIHFNIIQITFYFLIPVQSRFTQVQDPVYPRLCLSHPQFPMLLVFISMLSRDSNRNHYMGWSKSLFRLSKSKNIHRLLYLFSFSFLIWHSRVGQ
jgi:hypothetical protein